MYVWVYILVHGLRGSKLSIPLTKYEDFKLGRGRVSVWVSSSAYVDTFCIEA